MLQFETSKNVLLGTNSMEGALFTALAFADVYPPFIGSPKAATLNDLVQKAGVLKHVVRWFAERFFNGVDTLNPVHVRQRIGDVIADYMFTCPDKFFLDNWLKFKGRGRVYYYRLDYRSSNSVWNREWVYGPTHIDDLEFVFGWPLMEKYEHKYSRRDRVVAESVINMWSNFARTGRLISDVTGEEVEYGQVRPGPSGYVVIDSSGISEWTGFPKNLCHVLNINFFKFVGRIFSQAANMQSVAQSTRNVVTAPLQIVRQLVKVPSNLVGGLLNTVVG